jgi:iron complex transport system ATP-binding protein
MPPLIEYHNATVLRGGREVLNGLTLRIDSDEHVAIIGPNGSGKSTLIKTITRECYPQPADPPPLRILGQDKWNVFDLRALLGIVSNDLIQTCTRDFPGREIILSGFFSSIGIWPWNEVTPAMDQKTDEILDLLEISHLAQRNVDEMSSGEARRVVIGRALVHDPKALVLDEPTNSLDMHALHELRESFRRIVRAGTSLVMVTHNLPDIIPEIERVILLEDGRVVEDGPKGHVLTSAHLSRLFRTRVEVMERDGYFHAW